MASKIFKSSDSSVEVTNRAGGKAVALSAKEALAKYAVLCTFSDSFYASGKEQLDEMAKVVADVKDNKFIAKCAVYARTVSRMKDSPAYLLNVLYDRDKALFNQVFPLVVNDGRMLRTFTQIARSSAFKRNLSSRAMKRAYQSWFDSHKSQWVFSNSLGDSPSFADIIKMTHVRANEHQDLFAYLLDKEYNRENLPFKLKAYLDWKDNRELPVPDVNFRLLDSFKLTKEEWAQVLRSCTWNTLRMNLATFQRHGVFDDRSNLVYASEKLMSETPDSVFPYEVYSAYRQNYENFMLANALNEVVEKSVANLPKISGKTIVAIDTSASMGDKLRDNSSVSCFDVAAMFGACMARMSSNTTVLTFDTDVWAVYEKPKESILALAKKLNAIGGGTSISSVTNYLSSKNVEFDNLIIISDNESWADGWGNTFSDGWNKLSNGKRKLISIDLVPNTYSNASTKRNNSMFVAGFNDSVFRVISNWLNGGGKFDKIVESTKLDLTSADREV